MSATSLRRPVLVFMLTTLYHWALRHPCPGTDCCPAHFLAATVFWIATYVLCLYLTALARSGYTYGALATPIAFLLFAFFLDSRSSWAPSSMRPSSRSGQRRRAAGSGPDTGSDEQAR